MAKENSTLESRSPQVYFPITRKVTVLETITENSVKTRSTGLIYIPVQLEPCIVLRGNWLQGMGFDVGNKLTVYIEHNLLQITPRI